MMHARWELLHTPLLAPGRVDLHGGHLDAPKVDGRVVRQHVHRLERDVEPQGGGVDREHVQRLVRRREGQLPARPAVRRVEARDGERPPDVREPRRLREGRPPVYKVRGPGEGEVGDGRGSVAGGREGGGSGRTSGDEPVDAVGAGDEVHGVAPVVVRLVK